MPLPIVFIIRSLIGFAFLAALVLARGAATNLSHSDFRRAATCNTLLFNREFLVISQGRPGNISNADVQLFQRSFRQVYNGLKCGNDSTITYRQISVVNATRDVIISYGSAVSLSAASYLDQNFTWLVNIQGICKGCDEETFRLFVEDPPPYAPLPYFPSCYCEPPSKISFLQALNSHSLRPKSIERVLDIKLLLEQNDCPPLLTRFEAFLSVIYAGGQNTSSANIESQNHLLAESILGAYNSANALNTVGVCDNQYHSLENVLVVATSTNASDALGSSRRRHLSGLSSFNFIYRIRAKCRGCSTSTSLFNDAVSKGRRQLELVHHDDLSVYSQVHETVNGAAKSTMYANDRFKLSDSHFHRNLPFVNGKCYCQASTASRRIPTKDELIQAFNDRFNIIGPQGAGLVTIARAVQNIAQVIPVDCSSSVKVFTTKVSVVISTRETISRNVLKTLSSALQTTYNALASLYCDPLFRTIASLRVIKSPPRLQKQQQRSADVRFQVDVQCLGCSKGTTLFTRVASRSLRDGETPLSSADPSKPLAGITNFDQPRRIQQDANQSEAESCYCSANFVAAGAPTAKAFLAAFRKSLAEMNLFLAVKSVHETD